MKFPVLILLLFVSACELIGSSEKPDLTLEQLRPDEVLVTIYVGPEKKTCVAEGIQECLMVKQQPQETWTYFYDTIDGFKFEPGCTYKIRVARREIPNPPADGSAYGYRLLEIVDRSCT